MNPQSPTRRELSFDGFGINGPDEFRSRIATFIDRDVQAKKYGPLFEAAPEMLAALKTLVAKPDLHAQDMQDARDAIALAEGNRAVTVEAESRASAMWAVLAEFVDDIEAVGTGTLEDWPDLLITFKKARAIVGGAK